MDRAQTKTRMIELIERLIHPKHSEKEDQEIGLELDHLSPDPNWSDYIFWSDDYLKEDGSMDYDKFFKKIFNE